METIREISQDNLIASSLGLTYPIVSVIIPMYNVEKYIGECLDSILTQTFQHFEVIVIDDCSTDNSLAIVENYREKFDGRLSFYRMNENSGMPGILRNKGVLLSRGEYIQFVDSDDVLTKTALEELYTLAKDYDADVVYCERHFMSKGVGEEFIKNVQLSTSLAQKPPFVDKPTLISDDLKERTDSIFKKRFSFSSCDKFFRRKVMLENEIFFPPVRRSEDTIWSHGLIFCAKKFLRVPNMVYIQRLSEISITRGEKIAQNRVVLWSNPVLLGLKHLDNFMSKHEFFKTNSNYRYAILKKFSDYRLSSAFKTAESFSPEDLYAMIKNEFSEKLGDYDVLISALCTALYNEKKVNADNTKIISEFTARADIRFLSTAGNFTILSVSDEKANVMKPKWFQKKGTGYQIHSYNGKMEIVAKTTADGLIQLKLRGLNIHDPNDESKRIPYWIDYTKLTVNGNVIFDKLTPVWHDKPYAYKMNAKAGEKIKIEVEWLPHRSDN